MNTPFNKIRVPYQKIITKQNLAEDSVTRLGDFLHFGQFFKAFGNN